MSVFAQKLSRLRCSYSTLLRLWKKHDYPQRLVALSNCKFSTFVSSQRTIEADDRDEMVNIPGWMKENMFSRNLFLNSHKYNNSVMQQSTAHTHVTNEEAMELLNQGWGHKTDRELLSAVKRLSYNIRYSDEKIEPHLYENIFVTLHDRHQKLDDEDLMTLIRQLVPFHQLHQRHSFYQQFCKQLNLECVKRFMNVSIDNMLMLCDMLYEMTYTRDCEYIWYTVRKLGYKAHKLHPHQLIQLMFFLNTCQKPPVNMYELEYQLEKCLDELSINEIGIAALGFFKTKTTIRSSDLLNRIIMKTIDNLDDLDDIIIGGITKLIRLSIRYTEATIPRKLIDKIMSNEPRLTMMTLSQIATVSTKCSDHMSYQEEFLNRLIERLNDELTTVRLKDVERLIYTFGGFNIDSNNSIYHNVITELRTAWDTRRADEIKQNSHVVTRILTYLSYMNIYPTDLIERVMMPEYVHNSWYKNQYLNLRDYFVLDCNLRVEVPQYNGNFLKPHVHDKMLKKYFLNLKFMESSRVNVLLNDVLQTCQETFDNTSDIMSDRALPHFTTPDVILSLDEQNQLLPIKDHLSKFKEGEIKWMCKENLNNARLIALIMGYDGVLIKNTNLPTGFLVAKIRQLTKVGYTPIIVSHIEWEKRKMREEKHDYIRQLLSPNNASESNR